MPGSTKQLGRRKEAAILALLSQRSVLEAARSADVSERTLYRWMQEPDFDAAYRRARRAAFSQATARLQQMCAPAVSTLGKIMLDSNEPATSRVRAAANILDHAAKALQIEDVLARLSALECLADDTKKT